MASGENVNDQLVTYGIAGITILNVMFKTGKFMFTVANAKFALRVTFLVNCIVPNLTQQELTH